MANLLRLRICLGLWMSEGLWVSMGCKGGFGCEWEFVGSTAVGGEGFAVIGWVSVGDIVMG